MVTIPLTATELDQVERQKFWATQTEIECQSDLIRNKKMKIPKIRRHKEGEGDKLNYVTNLREGNSKRRTEAQAKYFKNPKRCSVCNAIIPYERRELTTCSDACQKLKFKK